MAKGARSSDLAHDSTFYSAAKARPARGRGPQAPRGAALLSMPPAAEPPLLTSARTQLAIACTTAAIGTYFMCRTLRDATAAMHGGNSTAATAALNAKLALPKGKLLTLTANEAGLVERLHLPGDLDTEFSDIAGLDGLLRKLELDSRFARQFQGVSSSSMLSATRGILLYGPPGTGKTMLAKVCPHPHRPTCASTAPARAEEHEAAQAFARRIGAALLNVPSSAIHSRWWGESERNVAAVFSLARKLAAAGHVALIFVDEVDGLLGEAEAGGAAAAADSRTRSEWMQLWDGLSATRGAASNRQGCQLRSAGLCQSERRCCCGAACCGAKTVRVWRLSLCSVCSRARTAQA